MTRFNRSRQYQTYLANCPLIPGAMIVIDEQADLDLGQPTGFQRYEIRGAGRFNTIGKDRQNALRNLWTDFMIAANSDEITSAIDAAKEDVGTALSVRNAIIASSHHPRG